MSRRTPRGACLAALLTAAVGCQRAEPTPTAGVDEQAVKQYQALLEQQIALNEEIAAILNTVDAGPASRDNAKNRLLALVPKSDRLQADLQTFPAPDLRSRLQIEEEAKARVLGRAQVAAGKLREAIDRVNRLPGGEDFFQKDLRQALDALKR
jgi:hypothetical protein